MHFITCVNLCYKSRWRTVPSPQRHPFTHLCNDPSPRHSLIPGTFQERYVHEIIQYVTLWNWPFSMSVTALTSSKLLLYQSSFRFFTIEWYSIVWMDHSLFTHWRVFWLFPVWGYYRYSSYEHGCVGVCVDLSFHFSGITAQEHNCWAPMVSVGLVFQETSKPFSRATMPCYALSNNVYEV